MTNRRTQVRIIIGIIIAVLVLVALYSAFRIINYVVVPKLNIPETEETSKTVTKDGKEYFPRQDITVFMLMGIDRTGPVEASGSYNNSGAADVVSLVVFDKTNKKYSVLSLNRDTMIDVPVLGVNGQAAGTIYGQLALSHTYGTGLEDSCENTTKAVSDFLGGIDVDYYMSMNMDAVSILTDSVGGVKVNVTEDFTSVDPTIPMGETVLTGKQALNFVRNRKDVGDQLNVSRMDRQKVFIQAFLESVKEKHSQNEAISTEIYNKIADYIVSNCPLTTFNNLIQDSSDYKLDKIVSPEGENKKGEQYMEFHVDEQKLQQLVIDLFYQEKPNY